MRRLLVTAAALLFAAPLAAQTVVYTTFGSGAGFVPGGGGWTIGGSPGSAPQSLAASFVYTGTSGELLSQLRLALGQEDPPALNVAFLSGIDIATATSLESWSISGLSSNGSIQTFAAVNDISLTDGDTYWVEAFGDPGALGAWSLTSNSALTDFWFKKGDGDWLDDVSPGNSDPAFDVSVVDPVGTGSTTPEPATLSLFATGLVGLGAATRRRVRR